MVCGGAGKERPDPVSGSTGLFLLLQWSTSLLLAHCGCAGYNDELRLSDEVLDRVQWTLPPDQVRTHKEKGEGTRCCIS